MICPIQSEGGACRPHVEGTAYGPCRPKADKVIRTQPLWYHANVDADGAFSGGRNSVVECLLPKQKVVGSNPIARSNPPTHVSPFGL